MSDKTYHLGFYRGYTSRTKNTVYFQARRCIDFLSCELLEYIGERVVTKKHLEEHKTELLQWINKQFGFNFKRIVFD